MQSKGALRVVACPIALVLPLVFASNAAAQAFPPQGDDVIPSLGSFRIWINPGFRPMFAGYPGYDGIDRLTSPTLADRQTVIGRSSPHAHGSPADLTGTPVGTTGRVISDTPMVVQPGGFQGPLGTTEVHTEIVSLNLAAIGGLPAAVRAGTFAPLQPFSPGEVESQNSGGIGIQPDFPADSFFDVFVEVDLPPAGGMTAPAVLFNRIPLLVVNSPLAAFPPTVVYIHGNSSAVPIYFRNANPPQWNVGDCLGYLVLAGHGAGFTTSPSDVARFQQIMQNQTETPIVPELVSPITAATAEGDGSNAFPWNSTTARRYTQIHSDLGGPRPISQISFRGNAGNTTNYTATRSCDLEMQMADSVDWDQAQFVFAANYAGPASTVFARRVINLGPLGQNMVSGPNPFTIFVPLDSPYAYTGVRSLLWDARVYSNVINSGTGSFNAIDIESGSTAAGTSTITGTGCIATGRTGAMTHTFSATDRAGTLVLIPTVSNGPSNAYTLLAIGFSNPNAPITNLCANLYTDLSALLEIGATSAGGAISGDSGLGFVLPNFYAGAVLTTQAVSLDVGRAPPDLLLSLSNGRSVTLPTPNLSDVVRVTRIYNNTDGPNGALGIPVTTAHSFGVVTEFR